MGIFLFIDRNTDPGRRLLHSINGIGSEAEIKVVSTIEELCSRLSQIRIKPPIVVLMALNKQELAEMLSIQSFINDTRIILILPDDKADTFALGCRLYPRYISYVHSDFKDVSAVLEKMVKNANRAVGDSIENMRQGLSEQILQKSNLISGHGHA